MEIVIMLFVVVGGSIAFSAWKKNRSTEIPNLLTKIMTLMMAVVFVNALHADMKGK